MSIENEKLYALNKITEQLDKIDAYLIELNKEICKMRSDIKPWYMRLYDYVKNVISKGN